MNNTSEEPAASARARHLTSAAAAAWLQVMSATPQGALPFLFAIFFFFFFISFFSRHSAMNGRTCERSRRNCLGVDLSCSAQETDSAAWSNWKKTKSVLKTADSSDCTGGLVVYSAAFSSPSRPPIFGGRPHPIFVFVLFVPVRE